MRTLRFLIGCAGIALTTLPGAACDTASLPEFDTTGPHAPGGERSFVMNTTGTTRIHCSIHSQMTGTLVVRER